MLPGELMMEAAVGGGEEIDECCGGFTAGSDRDSCCGSGVASNVPLSSILHEAKVSTEASSPLSDPDPYPYPDLDVFPIMFGDGGGTGMCDIDGIDGGPSSVDCSPTS